MTTTPTSASGDAPPAPAKLAIWVRGDTNAFFGLGTNVLVNVLVLTSLCLFVVQLSAGSVMGHILPALGIALIVGNVYYTFLARRLAARERRTDVTALPYGPSVPHMFIVVFVIMLPIYLATKDPLRAWQAGLAWCFIIGVIVLIGAFVGPYIRRFTPRAALLGTLAGISISFISMRPAAQMWEAAWIALPVLALILIGFLTKVRLPGNIPIGLAALLVGTAIGWAGGYMHAPDVAAAAKDIGLSLPHGHLGDLLTGLRNVAPLLATAIPLGVYNFTEGMTNVESAAAAGDSYNLRSVLLADGTGAIVGSALGSPFPPAVYIGHPGWKDAGGRSGYSLASGVTIALLCFLGMFGLLGALLPIPAIVPILLYIGFMIGAQAFQVSPRAHAAAVIAALIPNIASWAQGQMANVLAAAGTSASEVGAQKLTNAGVVYDGLRILGEGAILAGLMLGAIVAFIIDRRFLQAAAFCGAAALLSFVGLIHASAVGWNANGQVALGYLFAALVCLAFAARREPYRVPEPDELLAEHEVGASVPHQPGAPEPVGTAASGAVVSSSADTGPASGATSTGIAASGFAAPPGTAPATS